MPYLRYVVSKQEPESIENLDMNVIDNLSGTDFETVCAYLLLCRGMSEIEVTQATGDYGVDITGVYRGQSYVVQCKRARFPVGVKAIQEVFAGRAHYKAEKALVMSNSIYTRAAWKLARDTDVLLFDRNDIARLVAESKFI